MLLTLKHPFNAGAPTVTLQLLLDTALAKPVVAETVTIGFPFELTQVIFTANEVASQTYNLYLLAAANAYVAGDPLSEPSLVDMRGDMFSGDTRIIPYLANAELALMPRVRVPAGRRLRLVQPNDGFFGQTMRAVFTLTPL